MKELTRRSMTCHKTGMACGPMEMYMVDAEIVVEDEGHKVYLHTQWDEDVSDMILFEATTESLYDCYDQLNSLPDSDEEKFYKLIEERDHIEEDADISKVFGEVDIYARYAEQYRQLVRMMQEAISKDGVDFDLLKLDADRM